MEKYFENPSREVLESLYRAVNDMDLSRMPRLSWHERQILRSTDDKTMFEELFIDDDEKATSASPSITESWMPDGPEEYEGLRQRRGTLIDLTSGSRVLNSVGKDRHFYETKIDYEGIKLPIRVPLTVNNEEVGDVNMSYVICMGWFFSLTSSFYSILLCIVFTHQPYPHLLPASITARIT